MAKKSGRSEVQEIDVEQAKTSFINDFQHIKSLGYIRSHRSHNTGIGKTFEDVMKIEENNLQTADYMGCIELKAQRDYTASMLTLFTKSPTYPEGANTFLRDNYGRPDPDSGYNGLHTTIKHSSFNTFDDTWGFKLEINDPEERIDIQIQDLSSRQLENALVYYSYADLQKALVKCSLIAYILAETRVVEGHEEFYFQSVTLLSGLTFPNFLDCVRQDFVKYDIRIGAYRSGVNQGKTHDHGSGFRIKREDLPHLFNIETIA